MRTRCENKNSPAYKNYGGRGISICDKWKNFVGFYEDMGRRPGPGYSVDRIDNQKGYSKDNCRWATYTEQNRNRRDNRIIVVGGISASLAEHCERFGLKYKTVHRRLVCGASIEVALNPTRLKRNTIGSCGAN